MAKIDRPTVEDLGTSATEIAQRGLPEAVSSLATVPDRGTQAVRKSLADLGLSAQEIADGHVVSQPRQASES